jgi:NAD(P)H-hydrate epimerase
VIPSAEVRVLDGNAAALGVPVRALMERAGRAVAERVDAAAPAGSRVFVLVGAGNNGGDGLVAARYLSRNHKVTVVTPVEAGAFHSEAARDAWRELPDSIDRRTVKNAAEVAAALGSPGGAGVLVDALLGVGLRSDPRGPVADLIEAANRLGLRTFSVDVPSGMGTNRAIHASETITFHDIKEGMSEANCGRISVVDIGIPKEAVQFTGPGELTLFPKPAPDQHKGEGGSVLILGGGPYTGAPAVAGLAALRSGADLAILLVPRRAWAVVASYSPNLIVRPLNADELNLEDPSNRVALNTWLKKADAVVVGPGAGQFDSTRAAIRSAVLRATEEGLPVVADADALAALAEAPELLGPNVVVTPHAREFEVLFGEALPPPSDIEARAEVASRHARKTRATILVKGPVDIVADPDRVKRNATGHPAMSVGGTGDALAGIVGCLLAKGLRPFDAARLGAYISGRAGEIAAEEKWMGLVATDVVDAIPRVLLAARAPGTAANAEPTHARKET